jgi:hypothetical protein
MHHRGGKRLRDARQTSTELFNGSWALELCPQIVPPITPDLDSFNRRGNARTTEFDNQDSAGVLIEIIRLRSARIPSPRSHFFAAMPIA